MSNYDILWSVPLSFYNFQKLRTLSQMTMLIHWDPYKIDHNINIRLWRSITKHVYRYSCNIEPWTKWFMVYRHFHARFWKWKFCILIEVSIFSIRAQLTMSQNVFPVMVFAYWPSRHWSTSRCHTKSFKTMITGFKKGLKCIDHIMDMPWGKFYLSV